jgi:hypothetical protein
MTFNGFIIADGGNGGFRGNSPTPACASHGHGGSGGAIRLLANTIAGTRFNALLARGGLNGPNNQRASAGAIRLEAFTITLPPNNTDPIATRAPAPGLVTSPLTQTVEIQTINGMPVPEPPQGFRGSADVVLTSPGLVTVGLQTTGVPGGTVVDVVAKPQLDGAPVTESVALDPDNCNTSLICTATVMFNLQDGAFFIEAQATFTVP